MQPSNEAPQGVESLREAYFQRSMDLIFRAHPYYRSLFDRLALTRSDFASLADLRRLPLTTKQQYMAEPEAFRLRVEDCPELTLPERTVAQVIYTTGSTTGRPTPFYDTNYDHAARIALMKEATEWAGITADDVVANLFPLTPVFHQGFLSALYGPLAVGAKLITGFTGRQQTPFDVYRPTAYVAELAARQGATVLWGITSYVRKVVITAQEMGLDFSRVRIVFVAGEPCPPGMREDLRRRLATLGARDVVIQNGYGFTELQGPTIACCEEGPMHIPNAAQYYVETVDPTTHDPLPAGAEGLVVVSHLNRRGTILLRYVVGDVCALADDACPFCGREGQRFVQPPRRVGDLVKVKGTLINPHLGVDALSRIEGLDEFQLVVQHAVPGDPLSGDDLVVRAATRDGDRAVLVPLIQATVQESCEVTPRVELVSQHEFNELLQNYKFKRFVDQRRRWAPRPRE